MGGGGATADPVVDAAVLAVNDIDDSQLVSASAQIVNLLDVGDDAHTKAAGAVAAATDVLPTRWKRCAEHGKTSTSGSPTT